MAHLVAGYPSNAIALAAAQGLAQGGVSYFEVQLPFSDPSADGKSIQAACARVLCRNYKVDDGFAFIRELHSLYPTIPIFLMSYGNLVYKKGVGDFVLQAARTGVCGLIIPDLPFDTDEGLNDACLLHGLCSVPVVAPSMTSRRFQELNTLNRPYVYAALRSGITGTKTSIDEKTIAFLQSVDSKARILGGFGIRSGDQSRALAPHVHAVVAGSVFVDLICEKTPYGEDLVRTAVMEKATELVNGNPVL
jgi:tryptophan synthase alpha chain